MKLPLSTIFFMLCALVSGQDLKLTYSHVTDQLLVIDELDQRYRNQMDETIKRFGADSNEKKTLFRNIRETDSLNIIQVEAIINEYGWLGVDDIGTQANTTLFMVIQHSDLQYQVKYLPMMRVAVKKGNAKAGSLALLEDRVAMRQGRKQIYGSQVSWNMKTNEKFVVPLEDPDNVDKRRAEVGLPSLQIYLAELDMKWDVEKYKKELPALEEAFFKKNNKLVKPASAVK